MYVVMQNDGDFLDVIQLRTLDSRQQADAGHFKNLTIKSAIKGLCNLLPIIFRLFR